jgi:hypothetical protein
MGNWKVKCLQCGEVVVSGRAWCLKCLRVRNRGRATDERDIPEKRERMASNGAAYPSAFPYWRHPT